MGTVISQSAIDVPAWRSALLPSAATTFDGLGVGVGVGVGFAVETGRGFGEEVGVDLGVAVDLGFGGGGGLLDDVAPFTAPELLLTIRLDSSTASNARAGTCLS